MATGWNAGSYQSGYSFVWEYGKDLLGLLNPQAGERILDVGCGTGQLTAQIAAAGATVTGIDSSPEMIEQARRNAPEVRFEVRDACTLEYSNQFDGIFSNSALHWVTRAEEAARGMARALKPGGRLVLEMGARGNCRELLGASDRALRELGIEEPQRYHPWFFPRLAEYASMLERHGMEVRWATLFERPTVLPEGLKAWFEMFGDRLVAALPAEQLPQYYSLVEQYASKLRGEDGGWVGDYRRLRIVAARV